MAVNKPYPLTVREFTDGEYSQGGRWQYIRHHKFSHRPSNYIRSYLLLQEDIIDLFKYIEPSDEALTTFSFRIQELLVRTCIEVEANFKAIFSLNEYERLSQGKRLSIKDYHLVETSHFLSRYDVKLPYWTGDPMTASRQPFKEWLDPVDPENPWLLSWYQAYNSVKHDRANSLHLANFENLIDAYCGLTALITSQYLFEDFSPSPDVLQVNSGYNDGYDAAIGGYFRVVVPHFIPDGDRYDFDWQTLSKDSDPFQKFDYDAAEKVRSEKMKKA